MHTVTANHVTSTKLKLRKWVTTTKVKLRKGLKWVTAKEITKKKIAYMHIHA